MNTKHQQKRIWYKTLPIFLAMTILAGCSSGGAGVTSSDAEGEAISQKNDATMEIPTKTPIPTHTPLPPTNTPEPTDTPPPPSNTPVLTATQPEGRRGLIAFVMAEGGWGGIRVIQADGSSDQLILSDYPTIDSRPSWSPDGSQIAFESLRDDPVDGQHMAVYTMNSDGSHLARVTNTDAWYAQPDWSPDGSRIVMMKSQLAGDADLYVLDLNTSELAKLTDGPAFDMEPSWSPDALQIAFASDRDGAMNIFTLNVGSGELTQLTRGSGDNNHPDWSPDGKKILFVSSRDGDEEIYLMDADGANQSRLTTTPGRDADPEWSPDGNYFAYGHEEAGARKIYVSDLHGSEPELLFEIPDQATAGHPAWTMAEETISKDPVFGPPFCVRDTDGDFQPDTPSTTFSTEDFISFIAFPYDQMQDGMDFTSAWTTTPGISIANSESWDGGKSGIHFSYLSTTGHAPGIITIELYLDGKLMQAIECELVQP